MSCILGCNSTQFGPGEDEKSVDIAVQSVKDDLMIYGQITDCAKNNQPVAGALVKAFKKINGRLVGICHTFTGCNGYYMLHLPGVKPGEKVVVMATCGCMQPCPPPCPPQPCPPQPCPPQPCTCGYRSEE